MVTRMMTVGHVDGKKLPYRPVAEAELSPRERMRIEEACHRADRLRAGHDSLVHAASRHRQDFEKMARWIVATCRSGSEQAIVAELAAVGIEAWCPTERHRRPPRRGRKAVDIFRPYFRGYLFVRLIPTQEAFAGVLAASRLQGLMGKDGRPFLMPPKIMDALILAARKDEKDQEDRPKLPFRIGQRVCIRSGPFADFLATVRRLIPERWKMEAEVSLFSRMTLLEIDIDSIEA
ncbi:transcription termination/antitermination protein NusG [Shinella sp. BYT-45]|uniref:transcription termination/antitermination protein NusG n=1 Tax=Shinella sp. BYT-45 TaxID=3377377 RepID=UPI00397F7BE3